MATATKLDPYTPDQSTMREHRDFHPADKILRERGFQIVSRPRHGEVIWKKWIDGKWQRFTQEQAEEFV